MFLIVHRPVSVVTIFFAVKLTKAELPDWFDWILVAFVAFHVAVHVILSVCCLFTHRKTFHWTLNRPTETKLTDLLK